MTKIILEFPNGDKKEYDKGIKGIDVVKGISEGLARNTYAMKLNEDITDISDSINDSSKITFLTWKDEEGKEILRHSGAHIFAAALLKVFPSAKIAIGPPIESGFHYDFALDRSVTPDDLVTIEVEMKKIVDAKIPIIKKEIPKSEALELFKDNKFKVEMISEVNDDKIRIYEMGDFVDFCRGPHVSNSGMVKAFKLTKVSGAYWKGDAKNQQLQRIYGIIFPDKKDLNEYLKLIEEAEKRDHRKIGKNLGLYSFHDEAPGMPFFHNHGSFIWNQLVDYTKELMIKKGYEINKTPIILDKSLWLQSGHWEHYKSNMYFTKIDNNDVAVKPMNCPGNILIYKNDVHSYRDLPIRAGEFGLVHRHELSGVLSGLFRVRCFTQDDAHIFCTEAQLKSEIKELLNFIEEIYSTFGFEYNMELSTKPEKAMGDPKLWDLAEKILKEVLDETGKEYKINPGDGAFYGPKIDFHLKDAIGRTWQCGTIQVDFQMPEKFDLVYESANAKKERPVMVHRAILGSVERFMGILVEHYAGNFPLWISPRQVRLLPIADRHVDYCKEIMSNMINNGIRVELDDKAATTSKKIRNAQIEKVNYILVIGDKEVENKTVNVRTRTEEVLGEKKVDDFIVQLKKEIQERK
jgi:threonyl-tRNA synthetase